MRVSIGMASEMLGISPQTLRNWGKEGKVKEYRTLGNTEDTNRRNRKDVWERKCKREENNII